MRGERNTGFALLVVHKNLSFIVEFGHLLKTEEGFVELSHIKVPGGAGKVVAEIKKYVVAIGGGGRVRGKLHFTGRSLETLFSGEIYRKGGGGGHVGSGERSCVRSVRANTQLC